LGGRVKLVRLSNGLQQFLNDDSVIDTNITTETTDNNSFISIFNNTVNILIRNQIQQNNIQKIPQQTWLLQAGLESKHLLSTNQAKD